MSKYIDNCKWCNAECAYPTTKLCTNCWEVEHRVYDFLKLDNNRAWMQAQINQAELDAEARKQEE